MAKLAQSTVENLAPGYSRGVRDNGAFAEVLRNADGSLAVDCGWVVPEADEDDHQSFGPHPFRDGRPRPWVGRRVIVATAADAVDLLDVVIGRVWGGDLPRDGEVIGSVSRGVSS